MALLFASGSAMFLVPALAALSSSATWIAVTFFCGSICFTSASLLQLITAAELPHRLRPKGERRPLRPRAWLPATADWLGAAIQFPGTILFNVSTFAAMNTALSTRQVNVRAWAPDVIGSACFLVSSALAFANAEHRWLSWRPHELDWQIAACNLFGSIAFGVSALASFVSPSTGLVTHGDLANLGTAAGALGFLVGAILLVPASLGESARGQISTKHVDRA
jgi:ABC-type transport system involved in multi-copper enzyme maturation permease subunit